MDELFKNSDCSSLSSDSSNCTLWSYSNPNTRGLPKEVEKQMEELEISCLAMDSYLETLADKLRPIVQKKLGDQEIDIAISGGGQAGYAYLGCALLLKRLGVKVRRIGAISAGTWVGMSQLLMNESFSNEQATRWALRMYLELAHHSKESPYMASTAAKLSSFPVDVHEIISGRLFVHYTVLSRRHFMKKKVISEFDSHEDVMKACRASSAIPTQTMPGFLRYRGSWVLDGAFTGKVPTFPDCQRLQLGVALTKMRFKPQHWLKYMETQPSLQFLSGAIQMASFLHGKDNTGTFRWVAPAND